MEKVEKSMFERKVDQCREKQLDDLIHNASWDHAVYLVRSLLEDARDEEPIRIVSGSLNQKFYGKFRNLLEEKLKQGHSVKVVTQNELEKDHPIAQLLDEQPEGELRVTAVRVPHLILIGERAFRLEVDHEQTKAVASFNNPEMAKTIKTFFDLAWNAPKDAAYH